MIIRKTTIQDFEDVCRIYSDARDFMRESGNPTQWGDTDPVHDLILSDIHAGKSYVCVCDDEIVAVFYFCVEREPTYDKIDGGWLDSGSYGVVHRIASSRRVKGAGAFCLVWCLGQCRDLRIDTHRANAPMRGLLNKLGFTYCGIIWLDDGSERLAFQKINE